MPNPIQNNTETKFDKMHPSILIGPIVYLIILTAVLMYGIAHYHAGVYSTLCLNIIPYSVIWFGALGGVVISLHGIFIHNDNWNPKYNYWHMFSAINGAIYGIVGFLLLKFLIQSSASSPKLNQNYITFDIAAFILGYSQQEFPVLLRRVTSIIFGPGKSQGQHPIQKSKKIK